MNKIENLNTSNGATAQEAKPELTNVASLGKEIDQKQAETEQQAATEKPIEAAKRHMLTFMGQGVWIDSTGTPWSKTEKDGMTVTATFADDAFQTRDDLKFMVRYGAMKDILI